jgi:ATP-binding protein involved in chromosome partitioning
MSISHNEIIEALNKVRYPGTKQNIVEAGIFNNDLRIDHNHVYFSLKFPKTDAPFAQSTMRAAEKAIQTYVSPQIQVSINIVAPPTPSKSPAQASNQLNGVANIIAIASGKGGVGKSSVAANLAIALAQQNHRVALLDADIYGPSQPKMFSTEHERPIAENIDGLDIIRPINSHGVSHLSIGHFVPTEDAIIWRGAMASNAIRQLIQNTAWGELDVLLIDLPPGTGDIHLTIVQTLPLTGAIIVTTPQNIALADARKAISMFENAKVNVPILGIIENMSWFTPAELPGSKYFLFGKNGGSLLASETSHPLLTQIPIVQSLCESSDAGQPETLNAGSPIAAIFRALAKDISQMIKLPEK